VYHRKVVSRRESFNDKDTISSSVPSSDDVSSGGVSNDVVTAHPEENNSPSGETGYENKYERFQRRFASVPPAHVVTRPDVTQGETLRALQVFVLPKVESVRSSSAIDSLADSLLEHQERQQPSYSAQWSERVRRTEESVVGARGIDFGAAVIAALLLLIGVSLPLSAQYTYSAGDPSLVTSWTPVPPNFNMGTFTVTSITAPATTAWTIGGGATLIIDPSGELNVSGGANFTINGTLTINRTTGNAVVLNAGAPITLGGTVTSAGGRIKADNVNTVTITGTSINPNHFTSNWIYRLVINNAGTVTMTPATGQTLQVGNGGMNIAGAGNFSLNSGNTLILTDNGGATPALTSTGGGRVDFTCCGNALEVQDGQLDGNTIVNTGAGGNNLRINRAGGVTLTNNARVANLIFIAGDLTLGNPSALSLSVNNTLPAGRFINVNNGGMLLVEDGRVLTNNGAITVAGGGTLAMQGNGSLAGANAPVYSAATSTLLYTGATTKTTNILEWPGTMPGRVVIDKGGANVLQLNAAPVRNLNGALIVQSGYFDVLTGGSLVLNAASTLSSWMRVLGTGSVSGGNNLTVNASANLNLGGAAWSWVGTPTYNAGSFLRYSGTGTKTTSAELPATMPGNVTVEEITLTLGGNTNVAGTLTLVNFTPGAILNTGGNILTLSGGGTINGTTTLNVSAGGTLAMNNVGMNNNGALNVSATGVLNCINLGHIANNNVNYTAGGTLMYSGSGGSAATNAEFPGGNHNVIINKPGSAYGLTITQAVSGSFTLQAGQINLGGNSLTLDGPVNFSGGQVIGNATSNLVIGNTPGGAVTGPLTFATTLVLNNFTYNRPASLTLGSNLTVNGAFNLSNGLGTLNTGANMLRLLGASNTTAAGSTLAIATNGRLNINTGCTLTNNGAVQVAADGTLEINGTANIMNAPTYLAATSFLEYSGPTARPACGSELPPVFNGSIRVNNTGGVTAPNATVNLSAPGTASFILTAGNWILSNPSAVLQLNANPVVGGSATSYVQTAGENNVLTRTTAVGVPITFPVGTATGCRPVELTNPSAAANASVSVINGAPPGGTSGAGIGGVETAGEYWRVYSASAMTTPIRLTKAGAVVASSKIGVNNTATAGVYNDLPATPNVPNSILTSAAYNTFTNNGRFVIAGDQSITAISPNSVAAGSGTFPLTITGTNLPTSPSPTITFGGTSGIVPTSFSATTIVFDVPAAELLTVGPRTITITPSGLQATFNVLPAGAVGTVVSIYPSEDTFVSAQDPTVDFSTSTALESSPPRGASFSFVPANERAAYMKFDLSSIPAGSTINNATFELTFNNGFAWGGDGTQYLRYVPNNGWSAPTLNWTNAGTYPPNATPIMGSFWEWYNGTPSDRTRQTTSPDLRARVQTNVMSATPLSLHLSSDGYRNTFYSMEGPGALRPRLIIDYTPPPPVIMGMTVSGLPFSQVPTGAAGFTLTINGTNLSTVTALSFAGTNVLGSIVTQTPTSVVVNIPAAAVPVAVGPYNLSLSTAGGSTSSGFTAVAGVYQSAAGSVNGLVMTNWSMVLTGITFHPANFLTNGTLFNIPSASLPFFPSGATTLAAGATIAVQNGGTLRLQSGHTLNKDGTLSVAGGGTLEIEGDALIAFGASVQYQAVNSMLRFTGITNLVVGSVTLPSSMPGSVVVDRAGGTLSIAANRSITGSLSVNSGALAVNAGVNLVVAGTTSIAGGNITLNGTATMTANGVFSLSGGTFTQQDGTVVMSSTLTVSGGNYNAVGMGNLVLNGLSQIMGGFMTFSGAGNLQVNNILNVLAGQLSLNGTGGMTVTPAGTLKLDNPGQVFLGATSAPATVNGLFDLTGGQFDVNQGTLNLNGAINFGAGTLTSMLANGTVNIAGTGAITGALRSTSPGYALFSMNRAGASLALAGASGLNTNNLALTNGYIFSSATNPVHVLTTGGLTGTTPGINAFIAGELRWPLPAGLVGTAPPGNGPFVFPVGKFSTTGTATYLPVAFLNVTTSGLSPTYAVEAFLANPMGTPGVGLTDIDEQMYWRIATTANFTAFQSGYIRLGRPGLNSTNVVGLSTLSNGTYVSAGALTVTANDITSKEISGLPGFAAAAGPPAVLFYYQSGDPTVPANWNSKADGTGAPAADFVTVGNVFVVPANKVATIATGNLTIGAGVALQIQLGGVVEVNPGRAIVNNGSVQVLGRLRLIDNGLVNGMQVSYFANSALEYAGSMPRTSTPIELGSVHNGSLIVNNTGGVTMDGTKDLFGGLYLRAGVLTLAGSGMTVRDSLEMTGGTLLGSPNTDFIVTGGTRLIGGTLRTPSGSLRVRSLLLLRPAQARLVLGSPVDVFGTLSLLGGAIVSSTTNILTVRDSAEAAVVATTGYVSGPMRRFVMPNAMGSGQYLFPVGRDNVQLHAALDTLITTPTAPMVEVEAYLGTTGTIGAGFASFATNDHLRIARVGGGSLRARMAFVRSFHASGSLVTSTVANVLPVGAFNLIPTVLSGSFLRGGPVQFDSLTQHYFAIGAPGGEPVITNFMPREAPTNATITITGLNFIAVSDVRIVGVAAPFTVVSPTQIQAVVPDGSTTGSISVTTLSGTATAAVFRRLFPPVIHAVSASIGLPGTVVRVTGANLTDLQSVFVGSTPAVTFGRVNDSTMFFVVPDGNSGPIRIVTAGGSTATPQPFVILRPPVITEVIPTGGTVRVGTPITLIGTGFTGSTTITFGSVSTTMFVILSDNQISVSIPNGADGPPRVVNPAGSDTARVSFNYVGSSTTGTVDAPTITGFSFSTTTIVVATTNANGTITLSTFAQLTIVGTNLSPITSLSVGLDRITSFSTNASSTVVTALVPVNASGFIQLITPFGVAISGGDVSSVNPNNPAIAGPSITSFTPSSGGPGQRVRILGRNFTEVSAVFFGTERAASMTVVSTTEIIAVVGFGATGRVRVAAARGAAESERNFIYSRDGTIFADPVITAFVPAQGTRGTRVTILGENFSAVTAVRFGGIPVESYTIHSTTEITAVVGAGATGVVEVQTAFARASSVDVFTYTNQVPSHNIGLNNDSTALVRFYTAMSGSAWRRARNWRTSAPLSQWEGVIVRPVNGVMRVTGLNLAFSGIEGELSAALADLTELRTLNLSGNPLGAKLPGWLRSLRNLEELRIASAQLKGELIDEITELRNLSVLDLSNNQLAGRLPSTFCDLRNLRVLALGRNRLERSLPVCLDELEQLEELSLNDNQLTGQIPAGLIRTLTLVTLNVRNNQLTGALPAFGSLAAQPLGAVAANAAKTSQAQRAAVAASGSNLTTLDVSFNRLEGSLPASLGNLQRLSVLAANNNALSGTIPSEFWSAPALSVVMLHSNRLEGSISPAIGQARFIRVLTLDSNALTGVVPDSITNASFLRTLSLSHNRIAALPDLSVLRLDTLRVDANKLTFRSLEPNVNAAPMFTYRFQDSIVAVAPDSLVGLLGKRFVIDASVIGGRLSQYQWFKRTWQRVGTAASGGWQLQEIPLLNQVEPQLMIAEFAYSDTAAAYLCRVTNPLTPGLTLVTRPVRVYAALPPAPVAAPRLIYPMRGAQNLPTFTSFDWMPVVSENRYQLQVSSTPQFTTNVITLTIRGTTATVEGLQASTQYWWRVRAVNEGGVGPWSEAQGGGVVSPHRFFTTVDGAALLAAPTVDFGRTSIGALLRGALRVINVSDTPVRLERATLQEAENSFTLQTDITAGGNGGTGGIVLQPRQSIELIGRFTPRTIGTKRAGLSVVYRRELPGALPVNDVLQNAALGRGGALFVAPVSFDTVLAGRTALTTAIVVNRDAQPIQLRRAFMVDEAGTRTFSTDGVDASGVTLNAGDTTVISLRCRAAAFGALGDQLVVESNRDTLQADVSGYARAQRSEDVVISVGVRPVRNNVVPGDTVTLELYLASRNSLALFNATQPQFQATVQFDNNILSLDESRSRAVSRRGSGRVASVVLDERWSRQSDTVILGRIACRAVLGDTDRTRLVIADFQWGNLSAATAFSNRRVFVDSVLNGLFVSSVCQVNGAKRLLRFGAATMLAQSRPNPVKDEAIISYTLRESGLTTLVLYDAKGSLVRQLFSGVQESGEYEYVLRVDNIPSGSYRIVLTTPSSQQQQRIDVVK
jgi:Leucine-rich repeat (LRR) protein